MCRLKSQVVSQSDRNVWACREGLFGRNFPPSGRKFPPSGRSFPPSGRSFPFLVTMVVQQSFQTMGQPNVYLVNTQRVAHLGVWVSFLGSIVLCFALVGFVWSGCRGIGLGNCVRETASEILGPFFKYFSIFFLFFAQIFDRNDFFGELHIPKKMLHAIFSGRFRFLKPCYV